MSRGLSADQISALESGKLHLVSMVKFAAILLGHFLFLMVAMRQPAKQRTCPLTAITEFGCPSFQLIRTLRRNCVTSFSIFIVQDQLLVVDIAVQ